MITVGRKRKRERGHTLSELALVILLLSVLTFSVMPSSCLLINHRLTAAAERLAADLRYARSLALRDGGHVGIVFDTGDEVYSVMKNLTTPVPDPTRGGQNLRVDFEAETRFDGVGIQSASFNGDNSIQFDNLGVPRDGDYQPLTSNGSVTLRLNSTDETLTIDAETGRVTF